MSYRYDGYAPTSHASSKAVPVLRAAIMAGLTMRLRQGRRSTPNMPERF
jgi:hypothetical protein